MFELIAQKGKARAGKLHTSHGVIQTPFFMPIATKGAVKTLSSQDLEHLGAQILLSNTYHLLLRPGLESLQQLGGLHAFMNWQKPLLTDSGGYQVFSLAKINKITDEGVVFQSHIDGSRMLFTPETSLSMQGVIGSDIAMQFDDVAAGNSSFDRYQEAMRRSLLWAERSKRVLTNGQQLFGIVQGGTFQDLREESARKLISLDFDGYAIGGLSVGEEQKKTYEISAFVANLLPENKPRYFMGGGLPEEIVYYVSKGIDLFDCVLPTRNARHGTLFVWAQNPETWDPCLEMLKEPQNTFYQKQHVTNEIYQLDKGPVDMFCDCLTCQTTSKAYLRHLFQTKEILGLRLATIHNLRFYLRLMDRLKKHIKEEML